MADRERLNRARWRVMGMALQFGSTVIGALLVGLVGGGWLDRRLGTSPLFLLIGLVLAFIAIGYSLYELATVGVPAPRATTTPRRPPGETPRRDDEERDDTEW